MFVMLVRPQETLYYLVQLPGLLEPWKLAYKYFPAFCCLCSGSVVPDCMVLSMTDVFVNAITPSLGFSVDAYEIEMIFVKMERNCRW